MTASNTPKIVQVTGKRLVANVWQVCRQCKARIDAGTTFVHVAEPVQARANLCETCVESLLIRGAGRFAVES